MFIEGKELCLYLLSTNEDKIHYLLFIMIILFVTLFLLFDWETFVYCTYLLIYTVIGAWLCGRLLNEYHLCDRVDTFTVYFVIWQLMFITVTWEFKPGPIFSITLYRGWFCFLMACDAFIFYDTVCRYLLLSHNMTYFWTFALKDM